MELTSIIPRCFRHLQNACIFCRTRQILVSKPVSIFSGRPLIVTGFDTPLSCGETIFPAQISCRRTFSPDTLFRFGAKLLRTRFRGSRVFAPCPKKQMLLNKPDWLVYFSEMQEEFFEDKLRRIVSLFPFIFSKYCNYRSTSTRVPLSNQYFIFLQGFKYVHLSYSQAVLVMVKAEKRLGRKFTTEEIEDGTMGALLIESDFDTEKTVSRLPFSFRTHSLPFSQFSPFFFFQRIIVAKRHNWEKPALTMIQCRKHVFPPKLPFRN